MVYYSRSLIGDRSYPKPKENKVLTYLSPSSLLDYQRCSERFKLIRIDGNWPEKQPSVARDTGIVFDALCKCYFNRRVHFSREIEGAGLDPANIPEHAKAIDIGTYLFEAYRKTGALDRLAEEGVGMVDVCKEVVLGKVPVYGRVDLTTTTGRIIDWKVTGAGSARGASPRFGYTRRVDWKDGQVIEMPPHARSDWTLEKIDNKWAFQVSIYAFLLGHKCGTPLSAGIEQVAVGKKKISFCSFRNPISSEFQNRVWEQIQSTWGDLNRGTLPIPSYSKFKCEMYGKTCEVAHLCSAYQAKDDPGLEWLKEAS
jgi:hypothetical protein